MAEGGGGSGALRQLIAIFSFGIDTKELEKGENKLGEFFDKIKQIGEGIAAAFAVEKLYDFAEGQVHAATTVEHLAAQIGISAEAVQGWQYAAQAAGFESGKFLDAMSRLQVAAGSTESAKSFAELGISVKDAGGNVKDASALFTDVAEAVKKTVDPNKRAAIVTRLFGRSGRELLPFLEEGKEGIEELTKAYKKLGVAYGEKEIKQAKKFDKANADLGVSMTVLKSKIGSVLVPIFTKLVAWTTRLVDGFGELTKNSYIVQSTLLVLGAAAAFFGAQMLIAAAPVLLVVAAIAALILIIDDIITLFNGGDSQIGEWIDQIFGKGAHVEVVKELSKAWNNVSEVFKTMSSQIRVVWDFFKWIIDFGGQVGGIIGDTMAKIDNKITESGLGGSKTGLGKAEASIYNRANDYLNDKIHAGETGILNGLWSGYRAVSGVFSGSAPAPAPGGAGGAGGDAGDVHVTVNVGEETIHKTVDKAIKRHTRAAAVTAQRAGQPE